MSSYLRFFRKKRVAVLWHLEPKKGTKNEQQTQVLYALESTNQKLFAPFVGEEPTSDPGVIRTRDPLLRRQVLYPPELRGLVCG